MKTEQFTVEAKGKSSDGIDLHIVVTVKSTESWLPTKITRAKNVIFDMLRARDFDVDKIIFKNNQ